MGPHHYGFDSDTLPEILGQLIVEREQYAFYSRVLYRRLSESHGYIGSRQLQSTFLGSMVTYDNRMKNSWISVDEDLIDKHGAVSKEVVEAMVSGIREAKRIRLCDSNFRDSGTGGRF